MEPRAVDLRLGGVELPGDLAVPDDAAGVVVFAHGSGSSRKSPRNLQVAASLNGRGLATLLFDLLTAEEEAEDVRTARLRFDIELLAERLVAAIDQLPALGLAALPVGCFGASTGAAAALIAAARRPDLVRAVVSRGGRPDLAAEGLGSVRAPTLLVVGGRDAEVLEMNRDAMTRMSGEVRLEVVAGATHLFEEPGALETVAELASEWFAEHLTDRRQGTSFEPGGESS